MSFEAHEKLHTLKADTLKAEEPLFWEEITASMTHNLPGLEEHIEEVKEDLDDDDDKGDDSSLEMSAILSALVTGNVASNVSVGGNGQLLLQNEADNVEAEPVEMVGGQAVGHDGEIDKTSAVPTTVENQQTTSGLSNKQAEKGQGKHRSLGTSGMM